MPSIEEFKNLYRVGFGIRAGSITDRLDIIFSVLIEILQELQKAAAIKDAKEKCSMEKLCFIRKEGVS